MLICEIIFLWTLSKWILESFKEVTQNLSDHINKNIYFQFLVEVLLEGKNITLAFFIQTLNSSSCVYKTFPASWFPPILICNEYIIGISFI